MLIDTTQNISNISQLILKTSSPRPIAWIVTESDKVVNIAPFSLFTPLSFNPPSVVVSIRTKEDGSLKDTLANLRATKRCTICMVELAQLDKMNATADELPQKESEAKAFDIETKEIANGYPPIAVGSPVAYFCELVDEIELKNDTTVPVILNIREIYIDNDRVLDKEALKVEFSPLAHIAGEEYALLQKRVLASTN